MGTPANIQFIAPSDLFSKMDQWLDSPLGKVFQNVEKNLLEDILPRRFGYHLLQLGCSNLSMCGSSPIGHKFSVTNEAFDAEHQHQIVAEGTALPIASESVDMVLLHHALDFSSNQHQLLREASRVLIEGGDLIILGFNPYSSWGVRKKIQWHKRPPWQGQRLSTRRLTDWLTLLEFQVRQINYGLYTFPINSPSVIKYSSIFDKLATRLNWPTGGVYAISAKKQVLPMTPVQQPWKTFRSKSALEPVNMTVPENISQSQINLADKE